MSADCSEWVLDLERVEFGESGVKRFSWPYSTPHLQSQVDAFDRSLRQVAFASPDQGPVSASILVRILMPYWTSTFVRVIQAVSIKKHVDRHKLDVVLNPAFHLFLRCVLDEEMPRFNEHYVDLLQQGFQRPKWWRAYARRFRDSLRYHVIGSARLDDQWDTADCGVTLASKGAEALCQKMNWRARFVEFAEVFPKNVVRPKLDSVNSDLSEYVLNRMVEAMGDLAEDFTVEARRWTLDQLQASALMTKAYLYRFGSSDVALPTRILSCSPASFWDRMLRVAVRERGGEAIALDHGCGHAMHANCTLLAREFTECDRYSTYNETAVRILKDEFSKCFPTEFGPQRPVIDAATQCHPTPTHKERRRFPIRRILYVPFGTSGDRGRGSVLPADLVAVDFSARLIASLSKLGYLVSLKEHPSNAGPSLQRYLERLSLEPTNSGAFEEILASYDAVIHGDPTSTSIIAAIKSTIPLVILDRSSPVITAGARAILTERAVLAPVWFDEENRAQMHWENLAATIELASHLSFATPSYWFH